MVRNFVYPAPYAAVAGDTPAQAQGKRIKYWREQRKLTQEELGRRAGLKLTSISTLERGRQKNSSGLVKIAAALGVSHHHLTTGKGEPESAVEVVEIVSDALPLPPDIIDRLNRLDPNDHRLAILELEAALNRIETNRARSKQA